MSGGQLGTLIGQGLGSAFGPWGAAIGGAIGGAVGNAIDPPDAPDPGDLTAPKLQLGSQFGRPYGRVRLTVSWISIDPQFTVIESGGKGSSEPPTNSFVIDALGLVCDSTRVIATTREWVNKKLIDSLLAGGTSGDTSDYYTSATNFYGDSAQTPAPLYEARVGTPDALAYRGMLTREYASINCGGSKTIPLYEVEVITKGSGGEPFEEIFDFTGAGQSFVVPAGVTSIEVIGWGGGGAGTDSAYPASGGGAGFATSFSIAVTPAETLSVVVGGGGTVGGSSTFGGGGGGGSTGNPAGLHWSGGAGGGRSAVRRGSADLWAAPGGGGAGTAECDGAPGGGSTGGNGEGGAFGGGGSGGTPSAGGAGGVWSGGLGSAAGGNGTLEDGGGGASWNNGVGLDVDAAGGGGGGGKYGGGGGAGGDLVGAGGGGGSALGSSSSPGSGSTPGGTINEYYVPGLGVGGGPESAGGAGRVVIRNAMFSPAAEFLSDVILAELGTHPEFDPATVDVTDVEDVEVHSYLAVGSPVETIPDLCRIYYVDVVPGPTIKFVKKGRASVATIAWENAGVGVGQTGKPFEGLKQDNNDEISGVVGLRFIDLNRDHNANFVRGDRLTTEGPDVKTITTRVGLTPDLAKGRAITATLLQRQAGHTAEFAISNTFAEAEPGDCYTVEARDGSTYRLRIAAMSYTDTVKACKWHLEDASVYIASGITDLTDEPSIHVAAGLDVELLMVNLPSLRDEDVAGPGVYGVMWWDSADSVSASLVTSTASAGTYTTVGSVTRSATVGTISGALGDWTGGYLWDNVNSAEVVLETSRMSLSSSTYAAMYADGTINLAAIGGAWGYEVVAFRTATLTSPSTYTISGLLRGLMGTEWATGLHEVGDRMILLANNGILRVPHQASDLGVTRYFKAASRNSALAGAAVQSLIDDGTSLKPLSPFDVQKNLAGADVTVTWERRSRNTQPPYADPILSDVPESYYTELRNGSTVVDSELVSTRSVTYPNTTGYTVSIAQRNAFVGNGYEAEITL